MDGILTIEIYFIPAPVAFAANRFCIFYEKHGLLELVAAFFADLPIRQPDLICLIAVKRNELGSAGYAPFTYEAMAGRKKCE